MKKACTTTKSSIGINRAAYGLYLILVIYLFVIGDIEWAVTNLGIALVFDPFNPDVKWQQRPLYQKALLLVHVSLVLVGFVYLILK